MTLAPDLATQPATPLRTAPVQEVFSSVQGEGVHVGKRQVFVRFAHCHLKCAYCDTPMTSATGQCFVETPAGSGQMTTYENPMTPRQLADVIIPLLHASKHHSVSFTGGEPLLYHAMLKELFPLVRAHCPVYLETSGTQPEFLAAVLDEVDMIAMDIKLPSTTKERARFEEHAAFYRLAQSRPSVETFVKLVFNDETTLEELDAVKAIVTDRTTPIILQPETSLADRNVYMTPARLLATEAYLSVHFDDVRVIPQTHKMLKVL